MVAFDALSSKPVSPVCVAILRNPDQKMTAIESSYGIEVDEQEEGVQGFSASTLKWPGHLKHDPASVEPHARRCPCC